MIRHLPRTIFCLVMILVTATLVLNGCFSSDDTDPVIPEPARSPLAVVDLAAVGGTGGSVTLAWTSPQYADKATIRYDLRHIAYGSEDADWDTWTLTHNPASDTGPGQEHRHVVTSLTSGQVYAFGLKASTDGVEWTEVSNIAVATSALVFDTTPPATVTGLFVYKSTPENLTMAWPIAGDDGIHGQAESYQARYSSSPITDANWGAATPVPGAIAASSLPGLMETTITGLTADQEYHVALMATDDQGLTSGLSNVASGVTVDWRTFYINVEGTGDYPTIEAAIDAATVGDLILVGPGRYTWANQATGDSLRGLIYVDRDQTDFEMRSIAGAEATILDAQFHGKVMSVTGGGFGTPEDPDYAGITIDGFTFTNGKAVAVEATNEEGWSGGGLNLHLTDSIVRNCIFIGSEATEGAGLWVGGQGDAVIENCLFEDNSARKWGGGIMLINSEPRITVRNCIVRNNHATFYGGGVFGYHPTFTLENLLIVGNSTADEGGGIYVSLLNPDCRVVRCTVADNAANFGSAVFLTENTLLGIESSILAFNTGSAAFSTRVFSGVEIGCTLVFGHDQGNQLPPDHTDLGGNMEIDPLFCDRVNYLLQGESPCLPGNHSGGTDCGVIGATEQGCGP
jgi:hypothetical protein